GDWLPKVADSRLVPAPDGGTQWLTRRGLLFDCAAVNHPDAHGPCGLVGVVTFDVAKEDGLDGTAVTGTAATVYASTGNLYVAGEGWGTLDATWTPHTRVQGFAIGSDLRR